jgi:hypothetical protein
MDAAIAVRSILKTLVLPPLGPILLIWIAFWIYQSGRRWARFGLYAGLLVMVVLSLPVVADALSIRLSAVPYEDADGRPEGAIVILSGGVRFNANTPSGQDVRGATLVRLAAGAALARRTGLPILLSGGVVEAEPAEAQVMASVLEREFGLKAAFLEDRSRNTHENAVESARLLRAVGVNRVWLVTSDVHLPRAIAEFRAAGLSVRGMPAGGPRALPHGLMAWLPQPWALESSHAALYEWLGQMIVQLKD